MNRYRKLLLLWMVCLVLVGLGMPGISVGAPGINKQINFQGKLVNPDGTNVVNGSGYEVVFRLYSVASGGSATWSETQSSVTVSDGIFRVSLGSVNSLAGVDFNTDSLYLGIQVTKNAGGVATGDSEMSPRVRFTATPYAFNAEKVAGIGFSGISGNTYLLPTTNSGTILTTNAPTQTITSSQTSGTVLSVTDTSALTGAVTGQAITLSGSGAQDQTGLKITLSNATGANQNGLVINNGSADTAVMSKNGVLTLAGANTSDIKTAGATTLKLDTGGAAGITLGGTNATSVTIGNTGSSTSLVLTKGASGNLTLTGFNCASFTNGGALTTDASGNVVCSNDDSGSGGGGAEYWTLDSTAGVLRPVNNTADVLIGGTSTNSAKFAFTNLAGGTPTASFAGNLVMATRPDMQDVSFTGTNPTPGQFGADTAIRGATSSAIFKGKLFVATRKADGAGVYRHDGGNTWTLVTAAPGKVVTADTAVIDGYAMTVYNGMLIIGSQTGPVSGMGALYMSANAHVGTAVTTTWTQINTTKGQFATGVTLRDGVSDIAVYNGILYLITDEVNGAEVYRYNGGTGVSVFLKVSDTTAGKILAADVADGDGGVFQVFGGRLYLGVRTTSTTARIFYYDGNAADNTWVLVNTTRGQLTTGTTAEADIVSMTVHNGSLWVATGKTNLANIYRLKGSGATLGGVSPFQKMNPVNGKVIAADTATIDGSVLKSYNGRLYVGTQTGVDGLAGLYEYEPTLIGADTFRLISTARGTLGTQTAVDDITLLQAFNNTSASELYIGTGDAANTSGVYEWTKNASQSYAIRFDSGNSNFGSIVFNGEEQAADNNGRMGKFVLSHAVSLATGAFDYAEDYPTLDDSLVPGDLVAIDPAQKEYVRKATKTDRAIGIVSENPGFLLQETLQRATERRMVPVALVGRVPVFISTANGEILPGDYLTVSGVPGVAMKATKAGAVIGQAMEPYTGKEVGKILAYVNAASFTGSLVTQAETGLTVINPDAAVDTATDTIQLQILTQLLAQRTVESDTALSEVVTDRVVAGLDVITPHVTTETIVTKQLRAHPREDLFVALDSANVFAIKGNDASLASVRIDADGNAYFAGEVTAKKLKAETIEGLGIFTNKIAGLSERVEALAGQVGGVATASAVAKQAPLAMTMLQQLQLQGGLVVDGPAVFSSTATFHDTTSFFSSVLMQGNVAFTQSPVFGKDTAGVALIKKDSNRVSVTFSKEYSVVPQVSVNMVMDDSGQSFEEQLSREKSYFEQGYTYVVTKRTTKGFTIVLNKMASSDVQFSWIALGVNDVASFQSQQQPIVPTYIPQVTSVPTPIPDAVPGASIPVGEEVSVQ